VTASTPYRHRFGLAVLALCCLPVDAPAQTGSVTLEYVAHASFRIVSPTGERLLVDPYASRVWLGYDFPTGEVPPTVLITHPHYDHDGGRFRNLPVPWDPTTRILDAPGTYRIGVVTVHGIEGKHADPYGKEFGQINTIFVIEAAGVRIAHLGDNGPLTAENVRDLGRVDVLMIPIDGQYHILAAEAIDAILQAVAPRIVVPMHYRIPELERDADSPSDLGPLDPWLVGRPDVLRLDTHTYALSAADLDRQPSVLVFRHSPRVHPPAKEGNRP
jgi:L-ascorbate metabolism protein UlaG (beta-lactamase superfamily)